MIYKILGALLGFGVASAVSSKKYAKGGMLDADTSDVYFFAYEEQMESGKKFKSEEELFEAVNDGYAFPKYSKKSVKSAFKSLNEHLYAKGGQVDRWNEILGEKKYEKWSTDALRRMKYINPDVYKITTTTNKTRTGEWGDVFDFYFTERLDEEKIDYAKGGNTYAYGGKLKNLDDKFGEVYDDLEENKKTINNTQQLIRDVYGKDITYQDRIKKVYASGGEISDDTYRELWYSNIGREYDTMENVKKDIHRLLKDEKMTMKELISETHTAQGSSMASGGEAGYEDKVIKELEELGYFEYNAKELYRKQRDTIDLSAKSSPKAMARALANTEGHTYAEGGGIKEKMRLQDKEAKESAKSFKIGDSVELKPEYHKLGYIRKGKVVKIYEEDGDLMVESDNKKSANVNFPANYFSKISYAEGGTTKNWVQKVEDSPDFDKGGFSREAKKRGLSTQALFNKVMKSPKRYSEKLRKQAIFMENAYKFKVTKK